MCLKKFHFPNEHKMKYEPPKKKGFLSVNDFMKQKAVKNKVTLPAVDVELMDEGELKMKVEVKGQKKRVSRMMLQQKINLKLS